MEVTLPHGVGGKVYQTGDNDLPTPPVKCARRLQASHPHVLSHWFGELPIETYRSSLSMVFEHQNLRIRNRVYCRQSLLIKARCQGLDVLRLCRIRGFHMIILISLRGNDCGVTLSIGRSHLQCPKEMTGSGLDNCSRDAERLINEDIRPS